MISGIMAESQGTAVRSFLWIYIYIYIYLYIFFSVYFNYNMPGGGGVLGFEKGTNCGPTAAEWWLSRHEMAKKGGLSSYYIV